MKLVISRSLIKTAAQRWKGQYSHDGKWRMGGPSHSNPEQIYEQLRQLDTDTCPPNAVDDIIGNPSWSHYFCGSCHEYAERAVQLGDGYDESGAIACISCIRLALELLRPAPMELERVRKDRDVLVEKNRKTSITSALRQDEIMRIREILSRLTAEVFSILALNEQALRGTAGNSHVDELQRRARDAAEELAAASSSATEAELWKAVTR